LAAAVDTTPSPEGCIVRLIMICVDFRRWTQGGERTRNLSVAAQAVRDGAATMEWAVLKPILEKALAGLQSGFIRGAAVKVLQRLMGGNP
jgi:hypothetical protein